MDVDIGSNCNISQQKKHKKHKHKKHKRKKTSEEGDDSLFDDCDPSKPSLKLKIKFPKEVTHNGSEKGKEKVNSLKGPDKLLTPPKTPKKKKIRGKDKDSGTSSEEERWLDAIESGKLEEVDDELKKIKPKDPKLMTARQRAMFERKTDKEPCPGTEQLLALPSGYKEKVMTAEAIEKAALKSKKRKQLADEKREKDMKKTMERLLKKQESKSTKACNNKSRTAKQQGPIETYINSIRGVILALPPGMDFPLKAQEAPEKKRSVLCGVANCKKLKKYSCSKTGTPLCSLQCYKKNIAMYKHLF